MNEGIQCFYALGAISKAALKAGKDDKARAYAGELLALAPQHPKDWNYGNAKPPAPHSSTHSGPTSP